MDAAINNTSGLQNQPLASTPIAAMVAEMLSGGFPPDMIVRAVQAAEATIQQNTISSRFQDPTATRRRAWDREYRRRKRLKRPPDTKNIASSLTYLLKEEDKKESKEEQLSTRHPPDIHPTQPRVKKVAKRLPEDWQPSTKHYEAALKLGIGRDDVDRMAVDMRLWEQANHHRQVARKADWDATFLGWVRREQRRSGPTRAINYALV